MTYRSLKQKFGGPICRACINSYSRKHIVHAECVYLPGEYRCPACRVKHKHIVKRIRLTSAWKLWI